jgi:hypothetical protein
LSREESLPQTAGRNYRVKNRLRELRGDCFLWQNTMRN